jgi:predicted glycosyltransferase
VQSLLGSGHLRRAITIAGSLAEAGFEVGLLNGGPPSPWPLPDGVELVQLPTIKAADAGFKRLVDIDGTPVGDVVWQERQSRLAALLALLRPQVLITEMFPFGRRAFGRELMPLLTAAADLSPRPLVVSSVRDILVSKPETTRQRAILELARTYYQTILVHGDAALFPLVDSFPPAVELDDRLVYTGFVLDHRRQAIEGSAPAVLISAGGGAVAERLLRLALEARALSRLRCKPWLLVAGSQLPGDRLRAIGSGETEIVRHRADLPVLLSAADVSVSQAGYNTVVEALAGRARMVLVPFAAAGEDEQTRRAARLAELGLAVHLPEAGLDARALASAIDEAADQPRPDTSAIAFDGASRSVEIIARLLHRHAA